MAGRFSIESVFRAVDKVTAPVNKMQNRVSKFTRKAQRGFRNLSRKVDKFGKALKTVGIIGIASFTAMGFAMANVINVGAEFEQTLVNAAAKFPEGIRQGTEAFKDLETIARQVGGTTEFTASQAASGLNFLAMAGFNAKQSMAALPAVVDLATAAGVDLATASDIATDSLGAFGLATKDPIKLGKNLARVNDVLALATVRTNTNMEQLFEGIVKGAPAFTSAGQSMESFTALMGVMANSGIKGGEAGTILRNTVLRLSNPVSTAAKVMKDLGVEVANSDGSFRDILDIMEDFEKGLVGVGEIQKLAALGTVFGTRAVSGLSVQLKEGSGSIADFRKELLGASGTSKEMASVMRDTLRGDINSATSAFEGLKITLLSLKKGPLRGMIQSTTQFIRKLNALIDGNEDFIKVMDGVFKIVMGVVGIFGILVIKFIAFKAGIIAVNAIILLWSATMFVLNGIMSVFNVIIGAARLVMLGFNIALAANPIGLIIIAVVALIGLLVFLVKNWDMVVEGFKQGAIAIANIFKLLLAPQLALLKGIGSVFSGVKGLIFGSGEAEEQEQQRQGAGPQMVTPQDRIAQTIEERRETSTAEVTIKDETGRAEMVKKGSAPGVKLDLAPSGAF
jgi:TP901 family phage tail tape measure protein